MCQDSYFNISEIVAVMKTEDSISLRISLQLKQCKVHCVYYTERR